MDSFVILGTSPNESLSINSIQSIVQSPNSIIETPLRIDSINIQQDENINSSVKLTNGNNESLTLASSLPNQTIAESIIMGTLDPKSLTNGSFFNIPNSSELDSGHFSKGNI